jgi:B12-binding domain/radical SAM domain protein of rhizo-twelve system
MRFSLINPPWSFDGSIYFGCREPHLPLEFGYSKALLERDGHRVQLLDAQMDDLDPRQLRETLEGFRPDFTVITTAPSYLFWRCAPPELRVPQETVRQIREFCGILIVVGPHASTTPRAALTKLGADIAVLGECEEVLPGLAGDWAEVQGVCCREPGGFRVQGGPQQAKLDALPALHWEHQTIKRHQHHHHRFDDAPSGPGAEMETSRGCPYHCTFCAKENFRDDFRRRPVTTVGEELDGLIAQGVEYVYFIDEIFLPHQATLETIASRDIKFGIQTRIDLWSEPMIDLLGRAGCVSIEAGVESITEAGRELLDKKCRLSTDEITDRLIYAKQRVPFVQGNLLDSREDDPAEVEAWRRRLQQHGVWSNQPVPMFSYPGSPGYRLRWGAEDDFAWERAHDAYLERFHEFSDIQNARPERLETLELITIEPSGGRKLRAAD